MVRTCLRCQSFAWLAMFSTCLPMPALAAESQVQSDGGGSSRNGLSVADVELRAGGTLVGQVLDADARPVAGADVTILSGNDAIATTRTDASGLFAVTDLRGGIHQLHAGENAHLCRLWAPGTAPPASPDAMQIVTGTDVVRGQWGPPPGNGFLKKAKVWATNPFVIGGIAAAAIAIPVAIHNADDDGPAS